MAPPPLPIIDPSLLTDTEKATEASRQTSSAIPPNPSDRPGRLTDHDLVLPARNEAGELLTSRDELEAQLSTYKRKEPLRKQCNDLGLKVPQSASLARLREALLDSFGYANDAGAARPSSQTLSTGTSHPRLSLPTRNPTPESLPSLPTQNVESTPVSRPSAPAPNDTHARSLAAPSQDQSTDDAEQLPVIEDWEEDIGEEDIFHRPGAPDPEEEVIAPVPHVHEGEEAALLNEFGVPEHLRNEFLGGYDDDDDEFDDGEKEDDEEDGEDSEEDEDNEDDKATSYEKFQRRVRTDAAKRAEGNRRKGGIETQKSVVKAWELFVSLHIGKRTGIKDGIVDVHSLLLFIKYTAERRKFDRRGVELPGTFVGASQQKKLFYGVLRIRKQQDAEDITLASKRPATSVVVWDTIHCRMDEAMQKELSGLIPNEDAPDIIANTFLSQITDEQLDKVAMGFLEHREQRSAVNGHLAWTTQHATGNRGDDLRALRLCELQPFEMLHPNKETKINVVLGLQRAQKARRGAMKTTINPSYHVYMAHRQPEKCPLGAIAFILHREFDQKELIKAIKIDFTSNKSWRQVMLLHGAKSPTTPYSDNSLYVLYCRAFFKANFASKMKVHLPRHILGYKQEALGVDERDTAMLGWAQRQTYADTYKPALPKPAILGCHGYKAHEVYDPVWRRIHVPEQFLMLMCPMAETIHDSIYGKENLVGAANFWRMVICLRPILFQSGAAIFQLAPRSALFKLPALANRDVQNWMKNTYPTELSLLQAQEGSPIDLQRLKDETLRVALEELRVIAVAQRSEITQLRVDFDRRTAVLSPTKGFSSSTYHSNALVPYEQPSLLPSAVITSATTSHPSIDDVGFYEAEDNSLRAFVNASPKAPATPRARTQVDLVLPPAAAFSEPNGPQFIFPPVLGQTSLTWDAVLPLIKQPSLVWNSWKPSKTLDKYTLQELWVCYSLGEPVLDKNGMQTGMKPPLRLVEMYFQTKWRKGNSERKAWERFREIPEWIEHHSREHGVSPTISIDELEKRRQQDPSTAPVGLNALGKLLKTAREEEAKRVKEEAMLQTLSTPSGSASSEDASLSSSSTHCPPLGSPISISSTSSKKRAPSINPRRAPAKKSKP